MIEFDVVSDKGFLGQKRIAAGNNEKYRARFDGLLGLGVRLASATATVTSPYSTVSVPSLSEDAKSIFWFIQTTMTGETFTLAIVVTTTDGQTLNYTVIYDVDAPVVLSNTPNPRPLIIGPTGPASGLTGPTGPSGPGATGANGVFTSADGHTVTISGGRVTSIA